jgi:hypothetical protein
MNLITRLRKLSIYHIILVSIALSCCSPASSPEMPGVFSPTPVPSTVQASATGSTSENESGLASASEATPANQLQASTSTPITVVPTTTVIDDPQLTPSSVATQATSIAINIPISPPSNQETSGDYSGPRDELTDYEQYVATLGPVNYSGQRCRVDMTDLSCDCPEDTVTSGFEFNSSNEATWTYSSQDNTQVINLVRNGLNTWGGVIPGPEGIETEVAIVFTASGYQYTAVVKFPDGVAITCPMLWTRV